MHWQAPEEALCVVKKVSVRLKVTGKTFWKKGADTEQECTICPLLLPECLKAIVLHSF